MKEGTAFEWKERNLVLPGLKENQL